jgi:tryptophan synthase beta chain
MEQFGGKPDILVACIGAVQRNRPLHEFVRTMTYDSSEWRQPFGIDTDKHATLTLGTLGVLHGSMSYLIQTRWPDY